MNTAVACLYDMIINGNWVDKFTAAETKNASDLINTPIYYLLSNFF